MVQVADSCRPGLGLLRRALGDDLARPTGASKVRKRQHLGAVPPRPHRPSRRHSGRGTTALSRVEPMVEWQTPNARAHQFHIYNADLILNVVCDERPSYLSPLKIQCGALVSA